MSHGIYTVFMVMQCPGNITLIKKNMVMYHGTFVLLCHFNSFKRFPWENYSQTSSFEWIKLPVNP